MKRAIFTLVTALCVAFGHCSSAQAGQNGISRSTKYALCSAAAVAVVGASWFFVYRKFIKPYFASSRADNGACQEVEERAADVEADGARSESGDSNVSGESALGATVPQSLIPEAAREPIASVEEAPEGPTAPKQVEPQQSRQNRL